MGLTTFVRRELQEEIMKKLTQLVAVVAVIAIVAFVAAPAFADTLLLKSGGRVSGYYEGGTSRVVKFRGNDGVVKDYDILQVQEVVFGETSATSTSTSTSTPSTTTNSANPQ